MFTLARVAFAAPCCGGGSAIPSLLTGDDQAQLQASVSHGAVIGDAPAQGIPVFRAEGDDETSDIMRLDGSYRVYERFQLGAGLPVVRRARALEGANADSTGLGDATLNIAYEALPEWTYSRWKPHGFVFLQTTLPTGPSTYDAVAPYQLDARGRGFFSVGPGAAFLKTLDDWDGVLSFEAHRSFSRTVTVANGSTLELIPGYGASAVAGLGYNLTVFAPIRLGLSLSPFWESGIATRGQISSPSTYQLVWNAAAQASVLVNTEWSASLSFVDQTLVGPAHNVSLSRMVALAIQKRWPL